MFVKKYFYPSIQLVQCIVQRDAFPPLLSKVLLLFRERGVD